MEQKNFEEYLKSINLRNGGVHLVSGKGYGKSTALKAISRFYAKQPDTYVIICDTVLNWCLDFDACPYYTVKETDIQEKTKNIEIEEGKSYLVWAKEYMINPAPFEFLDDMIKQKQQLILFNVELQEIDLVGIFQAKIIDWLYQKQRIKKKYWKGKIPEQFVLISEETEAVFDNSLDRRIMSRTRKQYSEMANLRIAMFSCSQRLQEISTKFRGKMDSYLVGHTSIEDFDLKLNRMLKYSNHRKEILNLTQGFWLDTKSDSIISFPDFKAVGTPTEFKPTIPEQPQAQFIDAWKPKPKKFKLWQKILAKLFFIDLNSNSQYQQNNNEDTEQQTASEESELDLTMSNGDDDDCMFPTDP